MISDI